MDAGLSLIMTNHAKVKKNDLVFDPFVGTGEKFPFYVLTRAWECVSVNTSHLWLCVSGSLLVACSQFGAYVCGADIDYNTIHGKGCYCCQIECCLLRVKCSLLLYF